MPVVACKECGHEQIVPGAMSGLSVECEECGAEFVADDNARPRSRKRGVEPDGADVSPINILKAAGLIAGLLLVLGLIFLAIVLIVRTPDAKPESKIEPVPVQKPPPVRMTPDQDEPRRDSGFESSYENSKSKTADRSLRIVAFLFAGAVVFVYLALIVWCGTWLASDAYARGMSGLGWVSFYFTFQAICRLLVIPLAIIPSLVPSPD